MKFLNGLTLDLNKIPLYKKFRGEWEEHLDLQLLLQLSRKKLDYHEDTLNLIKKHIITRMKNNNTNIHTTRYKQSYKLGRFYSNTITGYPRKLKHTIFKFLGWRDLDMVKGHPSLAVILGEKNGLDLPAIKEYINNPQKIFDEMTEYYGDQLEDHQKKWLFNLMIYGGGYDCWINGLTEPCDADLKKGYKPIVLKNETIRPFEKRFKDDCDKLKERIYNANPKLVEKISVKDKTNFEDGMNNDNDYFEEEMPLWKVKNRTISYFLQVLENDCLYHLYEFLTKNGYMAPQNGCLEKDGICFKPLKDLPDDLEAEANLYTKKQTGFEIKWKIKPYEVVDDGSIELREINDLGMGIKNNDDGLVSSEDIAYETKKEEFEETHFKIENCDLYIFVNGREIKHFKDTDIRKAYQHVNYGYAKKNDPDYGWIIDKSRPLSFIDRWVKDENIKTYKDIGCYPPPLEVPDGYFNTWTGFPWEDVNEYTEKKEELQEILDFFKILCRGDDEVLAFLLKWLGNMLQYPADKNGLFPIFVSDEGIGKGTFCRILERLIGKDKFLETTAPEKDVWGKFNSLMTHAYLVYINEFGKKNQEEADGRIKGLLTDGNLTIECKGKDPYKFTSYHRFIGSTNSEDPTTVTKGNRRKWIIRCSDELKNNKEKFKRLYTLLADNDVIKTLYDYLMEVKCENMIGDEPPKTEYQAILETSNENVMEMFLKWSVRDIIYHDCDLESYENGSQATNKLYDMLEETPNKEWIVRYSAKNLYQKFSRFKEFYHIRTYDMTLMAFFKRLGTYAYNLPDEIVKTHHQSHGVCYTLIDWCKVREKYEITPNDTDEVDDDDVTSEADEH